MKKKEKPLLSEPEKEITALQTADSVAPDARRNRLKRRMKEILVAGAFLTGALILRRTAVSAEETVSTFSYGIVRSEDGSFRAEFPERIEKNGRTYRLSDVIYHEHVTERRSFTAPETELPEEEVFIPEETVVSDGATYVLESVLEERRTVSGRSAEATEEETRDGTLQPASDELYARTLPSSVTDPVTGKTEHGEIPYVRSEESGSTWVDDLSFRLIFTESDADYFELAGSLYANDPEVPLPERAYPAILKSLDLDPERNRIRSVVWDTGPYADGGTLCRDASVRGETLHRLYTDIYEGTVSLPDLKYVVYRPHYLESDEDLFRRTEADAEAVYTLEEE